MPGSPRQIDDNQDDLGRDVNDSANRIGDRATIEKTEDNLPDDRDSADRLRSDSDEAEPSATP